MSQIGDVAGHGTHVAGIIGAVGNDGRGIAGINWNVRILAVNVFSYNRLGEGSETARTSDVIRGIDFVIAAKHAGVNIRAANISLGGWFSPSDMEGSAYDDKIKELSDAGVVVCMAAGNNGQDIDDSAKFPGQRFYPAAFRYENTIAVGALTQNADGSLLPDTPDNGGKVTAITAQAASGWTSSRPAQRYTHHAAQRNCWAKKLSTHPAISP